MNIEIFHIFGVKNAGDCIFGFARISGRNRSESRLSLRNAQLLLRDTMDRLTATAFRDLGFRGMPWPEAQEKLGLTVDDPEIRDKYNILVAVGPAMKECQKLTYCENTRLPRDALGETKHAIHGTSATHPWQVIDSGLQYPYFTNPGRCGVGVYAYKDSPRYSFWGYTHYVRATDGHYVHLALILEVLLPEQHKATLADNSDIAAQFTVSLPGRATFVEVKGYAPKNPFFMESWRNKYTCLDNCPSADSFKDGVVIAMRNMNMAHIKGIIAFAPKDSVAANSLAEDLTFQRQPEVIEVSDDDAAGPASGPAAKKQRTALQKGMTMKCLYCGASGSQVVAVKNPTYTGQFGCCRGWCYNAEDKTYHFYGEACPPIQYQSTPDTPFTVPIMFTDKLIPVKVISFNGVDLPNSRMGFRSEASKTRWLNAANKLYYPQLGNMFDILATPL